MLMRGGGGGCFPGSDINYSPEECSWRSSALHHSQHHRAGQTFPEIPGLRPGCPAGGAGQSRPAAEDLQAERGAGDPPEGPREAGKEEKEETDRPQSSQLPEKEEEERCANTSAEEPRGGAAAQQEAEQTQRTGTCPVSSGGFRGTTLRLLVQRCSRSIFWASCNSTAAPKGGSKHFQISIC